MFLKWIKKTAVLLAVCLMAGTLSGCNKESESAGTSEASNESNETVQEEINVKIGYVFSESCNERGFAYDNNNQRIKALEHSDFECVYIDNVLITEFNDAVDMLINDGCNVIISGSSIFNNSMNAISKRYMNVDFINYGSTQVTANTCGYTENIFQCAYAAGVAAAFNSDTEKVGIICDPFLVYTTAVTNAAALGVRLVFSDGETVLAQAHRDSEIHEAVNALADAGCDVIISYTASGETVDYCESKGIKVIGNSDYRDFEKDYEHLLLYYYADRSSFYLSQLKTFAMGEWTPHSYVGSFANGVLEISAPLKAAAEDTDSILNELIPKITNGSAYIFSGEIKDTKGNVRIMQGQEMTYSEIYDMSWYVQGVDNSLDSFVKTSLTPESTNLEIKS